MDLDIVGLRVLVTAEASMDVKWTLEEAWALGLPDVKPMHEQLMRELQ